MGAVYHTPMASHSGSRYRLPVLGKVWLVGAGPGDPGLITVRGREVLGLADVVLHDALSHPGLLAACPQAELRDVGKQYGKPNPPQEWITDQLVELARAGKQVARLKGGDPFLFARGAEEALALHDAGIPFEIVPGISSPVAASAYAGFSLTHRGRSSSVTFITGTDRHAHDWSPEAWHRLATATDTICVLMGMRRIGPITRALIDGGRAPTTPAAVVHWGARPEQVVIEGTLGTIAEGVRDAGVKNPAVIFIGDVTELRASLRWYDSKPLFGKRIIVPRPAHQAPETALAIRARAAEPLLHPVVEVHAPPEPERLVEAVRSLGTYDWVLFTSANGVDRTFAEIERQGLDARRFASAKVAVIGPKTRASLARYGIHADLVAREYVAESLVRDLLDRGPPRRALLLRALEAREVLPDALREAGCVVDVVPAYETRPIGAEAAEPLRALLGSRGADVVLLTSGAIANSFLDALGPDAASLLQDLTVSSIGPVTSTALRQRGVAVDVEAGSYTVDGLLDALERHFSSG